MAVVQIDRRSRVADIVSAHPDCARVLVEHRIDFCFRGERTLQAACLESGVDPDVILPSLRRVATRAGRALLEPATMSTPELISFIMSRHHAYLFASLPFLEALVAETLGEHDDRDALVAVQDHLRALSKTLRSHLYEEEAVLFPALRAQPPDWTTIAMEFVTMHEEHLELGAQLRRLRASSGDYLVHDGVRSSYLRLMRAIAELEIDTMRHIHIETHVLMRRFASRRP